MENPYFDRRGCYGQKRCTKIIKAIVPYILTFYLSIFVPILVFADTPSRSELASKLAASEQKRSWFQMHVEHRFEYEVDGKKPGDTITAIDVLSDGDGRFRITLPHMSSKQVDTITWDQNELRELAIKPSDDRSFAGNISIREEFPRYVLIDQDLWPTLGLMLDYPVTEKFPITCVSEVLKDVDRSVEISEIREDDRNLVKIVLRDPFNGGTFGPDFTLYYDPLKDWFLVRYIKDNPGPLSKNYEKRYTNELRIIKSEEVDGVWMPTLAKDKQTFYHGNEKQADVYIATIKMSDIQLQPSVSQDDFTIKVSDLPNGLFVLDARLNISYKLGQNLIYMNGHLNEVKQPIDHEIKPGELKNLMKDAIAYIDPVATANEAKLKTVTPKGKYAFLTHWGFILLGLAFASMGIILWRKNHP